VQPAQRARASELDETLVAFRRVGAAIKGRFHAALVEHGLTFPQWMVLKALRKHGRMTAREVAESLEVTPANVTGILDRLEDSKLVRRTRSDQDRRVVHVALTKKGQEKVEEITGLGTRVLGSLFDGWNAKEHADFRRLLERVQLAPGDATEY
jgi:DNA-binding MarR family transcriptional regulator